MQTAANSPASHCPVPLFLASVSAGFPSPADDFLESRLDLNEHLIRHPAATFLVRARGDSMTGAGIFPGSLLVVDRSLTPRQDSIVLAVVNGEFTVKRLRREGGVCMLYPENPAYSPLRITDGMEFAVWGVVSHAIRTFT